MIWGRKNELSVLQNSFNNKQSQIIAIYGRRRIGKSYLVDAFCKNKKHLKFEGLESEQVPDRI